MTISKILSGTLLGLTLATVSLPAFAQDAAGGADPQVPFDEGRSLMKSNRFAEAAQKFEESLAIKTTSGALLNLGDCYEKLGKYASAVNVFEKARELSEKAQDVSRAQEAIARSAPLRGLVSTLTVKTDVQGATATLDKQDLKVGSAVQVDGGDRMLVVSAACFKPHEERVSIGLKGDAKTVTVKLEPSGEAGCSGASASASSDGLLGKNQKMIGLVVGAVGVVGLGVGAYFGLDASGKKSDLEGACTDYPRGCPVARKGELDGLASDADSSATIATIGIIAGAVLVAGGVVLFLTAPNGSSTSTTGKLGQALTTGLKF